MQIDLVNSQLTHCLVSLIRVMVMIMVVVRVVIRVCKMSSSNNNYTAPPCTGARTIQKGC